jgi:hypothetical protein
MNHKTFDLVDSPLRQMLPAYMSRDGQNAGVLEMTETKVPGLECSLLEATSVQMWLPTTYRCILGM